jgi:hypothetical protein
MEILSPSFTPLMQPVDPYIDIPLQPTNKNWTKWGKLFGSWSAEAEFYSDTDKDTPVLQMYVVSHITCDQNHPYARECGCDTLNSNQVCNYRTTYANHHFPGTNFCLDIEDSMRPNQFGFRVQGGDAVMYFTFGVSLKFPLFNVDKFVTTNNWMGPYTLLLPDNNLQQGGDNVTNTGGNLTAIRYVSTAVSDMISQPYGYNVTVDPPDFTRLFGQQAINATLQTQHKLQALLDANTDPYAYALACDNGDVKPLLPLLDFYHDANDEFQVKFKYQTFIYPDNEWERKLFNTWIKDGYPIKGPYCWNGELQGYFLDFNFDTAKPNKNLNFKSGCFNNTPCVPEFMNDCGAAGSADISIPAESGTIELAWTIYFAAAAGTFLLLSLILGTCMCRQSRKHSSEMKTMRMAVTRDSAANIAGLHLESGGAARGRAEVGAEAGGGPMKSYAQLGGDDDYGGKDSMTESLIGNKGDSCGSGSGSGKLA